MHDIISLDSQATLAVNGSSSLFWDNVMSTVTSTFSWSLLIIMLFYIIFKNNRIKESLTIILCLALMIFTMDTICHDLVKQTVARWRPTQDPQIMYLVDTVNGYRGGRYGFFSGHASNTFCVAMFLAWLFRYGRITCILFLWAATTTYTRLYLGVHYVGDVVVGALAGCLVGFLFYLLYNWVHSKLGTARLISGQFTSTGYLKDDLNRFLMVVFLNYILVILVAVCRGV